MTDDNENNNTDIPAVKLSPERVKAKADILEANIYTSVHTSKDGINASFQIDREGLIPEVLARAIQQLLENYNIKGKVLAEKILAVLGQQLDDSQGMVRLTQTIKSGSVKKLERTLQVGVSSTKVLIDINGTQPVDGIDGDVREYFFEHENYPGKILPNGKIDFREINRFPSIQKGMDLMLVNYARPGKPGITFSGAEVPVVPVADMNIEFGEGVEKIDKCNEEGNPEGYLIRSRRTGVVVLKKDKERITAIDITDHIELDEVDFSIGNIGSEFICPVSLKVGVINTGFRIKVDGEVFINILNGGEVQTKSVATVDQIQPGSRVWADQQIITRIAIHSFLESPQGTVSIAGELRDSELLAARVEFTGTKGLLQNASIDTEDLQMGNVSIAGDNFICLGKSLFERRNGLLKQKRKLTEKVGKVQQLLIEIKNHLVQELKELNEQQRQIISVDEYKLLIQSLKTFSFQNALLLLEKLKQQGTTSSSLLAIRKNFQAMQQLKDGVSEAEEQLVEIGQELETIENRLNRMKFSIKGKIKPASAVFIYCTKEGKDGEAAYKIDPNQKEGHKLINVSGRYSLEEGLVLNL